MSEVKVNKITPRAACGTTQLGDSGDTITIPSGATIQNLGTATGFGGTGVVSWDTASIKTTGFTAVTGTGYFCDTTGGGFTVTLPLSPSAGDVVGVADYAQTFDTGTLQLGRNSEKINGAAEDAYLGTEGLAVTIVYVDSTKGWITTDSGLASDVEGPTFVAASGGCITTVCTNYKVHTFTGPGTFCVSCGGNSGGSNSVDYLVIAGGGGGGGGGDATGGGGAGGYRYTSGAASGCFCAGPAPLAASALVVSVSGYPIVIGAGGAGHPSSPGPDSRGTTGADTVFSTITSTGGGGAGGGPGGVAAPIAAGKPGGSGGGAGTSAASSGTVGAGNTPSVSPPQGFSGGTGASDNVTYRVGGGGGGAGVCGTSTTNPAPIGGPGGNGLTNSINATPTARGGGGGGGGHGPSGHTPGGTGGTGGGGAGQGPGVAVAGTVNTGGGGGGGGIGADPATGFGGGSGIVIIRYKFQ